MNMGIGRGIKIVLRFQFHECKWKPGYWCYDSRPVGAISKSKSSWSLFKYYSKRAWKDSTKRAVKGIGKEWG